MNYSREPARRFTLFALFLLFGIGLGCPEQGLTTDLRPLGGAGGNYFRAECPKGFYLVGLAGRAGEWVDRIAPVCAPWLRGSQTFGAPSIGPSFGASGGGQEQQAICRGVSHNQIIAVQSWHIDALPSGNRFVQYIQAYCLSLAPPADQVLWNFGSESAAAKERVTSGPYGTACPAGEAPVGIHGRAGLFVDAVGLICGPLPVGPGAPAMKVNPSAQAVNLLIKAPPPADDMFTIIRPATGDRVQQGQLVVTAMPPKVGMTAVTELEIKWLEAPPNQANSYPYTTVFSVDTSQLLQGYPVAQIVTGGYAGRWQVRARSSMKAVPGPWSFPVQFQLIFTQATQSQKQAPSPMQQAPLPGSSVLQAPSQGLGLAPSLVRPPTTSPQGGASGGLFVRPRGVDGQEGTKDDQTPSPVPEAGQHR